MSEAHAAVMEAARDRLAAIATRLQGRRIVFLGFPLYPNVGDLLIDAGTEQFFQDFGVEVAGRYANADLGRLGADGEFRLGRRIGEVDRRVADGAGIVCSGGGNFGDLWPEHQKLREAAVRRYSGAPITVLPQSVCFVSERAKDKAAQAFGGAAQAHVYCRDAASLAALEGFVSCSLAPDMAHQLWGRLTPAAPERTEPVLVQSRGDAERVGAPAVGAFDWPDLISGHERQTLRVLLHSRKLWRSAAVRESGDQVWRRYSGRLIERAVNRFGGAERVETDRLHGLILAALLSKPVGYRDNSYGKVSGYAQAWLADSPLVSALA